MGIRKYRRQKYFTIIDTHYIIDTHTWNFFDRCVSVLHHGILLMLQNRFEDIFIYLQCKHW